MKKITPVLIACLVLSCNSRTKENCEITIKEFPVEEKLMCSIISVPPIILSPGSLFITGNNLIIVSPRKDTVFDIFSFPDFQFLFSAGVKGGGPDDFMRIDRRRPAPTDKGFNLFLMDSKKYRHVEINNKTNSLVIEDTKYHFEQEDDIVNGFMQLNDSLFIYFGGFTNNTEYKLLNSRTNKIQRFSPYPNRTDKNSNELNATLYLKGSTGKPDGKLFASFYANFKRWRIFDYNGLLIRDISVAVPPFTTNISTDSDRYTFYDSYPFATDNYIYVFCRNMKQGESRKDNTELQIWDWDGQPVAKYILDKYLTCFTVDEKEKNLYGVNNNEGDEDKIFKYYLPSLLTVKRDSETKP